MARNGMLSESKYKLILVAVAMLSLEIVSGEYLLGDCLLRARQADRSVTVKGLAEKNVTGDLATSNLSFSKQGFDINDVQSAIDHDVNEIRAFFKTLGFPVNALSTAGVTVHQWYASTQGVNNVPLRQRRPLRTTDTQRAAKTLAGQAG